ncbi:MAG: HNH endonuclease signature motif containing protein [Promethearchaeota archaeon]
MKKKRKKIIRTNRHHIIPRSRGGCSIPSNIAIVRKVEHQHYHALFVNRKPDEIVDYLVSEFWNGRWEYVEQSIERYCYPSIKINITRR